MPAIDATGERFSSDRRPGMDRQFIANSRDRASRLCVGNFFAGFRRWLPLVGMAFCLLVSCLIALTFGQLFFGRLSMVSVGFCAILVGLGVDFAILTVGRYDQARTDGEPHQQAIATSVAKLGRAVFFGALTTAVGFLALVLSGAMSFS